VHRTELAHCSVRPSSISKLAQGHAGMNWLSPPDRRLARVCMGAVPIAPFRPRADTDRQRCVSTAPAAALTLATCLPASTSHACSRHPVCSVSSRRLEAGVMRARDRCAAAAATSRRRCRPTAMSAPRTTHAAAAPCVTPSHYRPVGEDVSPLPATAVE
jgi:hypothetical protein